MAQIMTVLGCIAVDSGRLAEADRLLTAVWEKLPGIEDEEGCLALFNAVVLARLRARQGRAGESEALFKEVSDRLSYCVPRGAKEWRHLFPVTAAFHESRGDRQEATRYREALERLNRIARGEIPDWWKQNPEQSKAVTSATAR
jgi:hypothetical protein